MTDVLDKIEAEALAALKTSQHKRSRDTKRVLLLVKVVRKYRGAASAVAEPRMVVRELVAEAEALLSGDQS